MTGLKELLDKFEDVFSTTLEEYKKTIINLKVKDEVKPIFCEPNILPFAYKTQY